jgi:hypothetical protein
MGFVLDYFPKVEVFVDIIDPERRSAFPMEPVVLVLVPHFEGSKKACEK